MNKQRVIEAVIGCFIAIQIDGVIKNLDPILRELGKLIFK